MNELFIHKNFYVSGFEKTYDHAIIFLVEIWIRFPDLISHLWLKVVYMQSQCL